MDDTMQAALEQAYKSEHGDDPTIFPVLNALHGSPYHQFMVTGTILADKGMFIFYLLTFIMIALVSRFLEENPKKRHAKSLWWADVIGTFVLTFIFAGLLIHFTKHGLHMPRPYVGLPPEEVKKLGPLIEKGEDYMSFPSGHAAFATMIAASLWPVLHKVGRLIACLCVLWAACSRVVLGLHYPADVMGGIAVALLVALIVRAMVRRFLRRYGVGGL
jgi:membrane-associated phospholipid phosphatase